MLTIFLVIILGYLLGSIPTGYWLAKLVKGIDIRQVGSKSIGATNVLRCVGKWEAAFVFFFDIFKGYLAVWLCLYLQEQGAMSQVPFLNLGLIPLVVAIASLIGHSKSIFLDFQGGKSAATSLGNAIAMNPLAAFESFITWLSVLIISRFVSLASMIAVISSIFWMIFNHAPIGYIMYCILGGGYIIVRHRANIARLIAGCEPKLGEKLKGNVNNNS